MRLHFFLPQVVERLKKMNFLCIMCQKSCKFRCFIGSYCIGYLAGILYVLNLSVFWLLGKDGRAAVVSW